MDGSNPYTIRGVVSFHHCIRVKKNADFQRPPLVKDGVIGSKLISRLS